MKKNSTLSPSFIVITPGDPDGVGPEITLKALRKMRRSWRNSTVICVGSKKALEKVGAKVFEIAAPKDIPSRRIYEKYDALLISAPSRAPRGLFLPGYQAGWSIQKATEFVLNNKNSALVTGPIHKKRLNAGGFRYSGHTDFLSDLCGRTPVTMMLANQTLRVSLVTTHIRLGDVPTKVTSKKITDTILRTYSFLKNEMGIKKPHIAVCAINPHAGEGGLFGREDDRITSPTIKKLSRSLSGKVTLSGPHPSDTYFAKHLAAPKNKRADAVIGMYHDQGLIPVKLIDFPNTVNITLGLPIIRTSVDHGTAFDIAGKNLADPSSLIAAVEVARQAIANRRKKRIKK